MDERGPRAEEWNADSYDGDHSFVYEYGADLLESLDHEAGERVLDLGCGTGQLSRAVADDGAAVVGIDASAEMIERARETCPDGRFVVAGVRSFAIEGRFDAVLSNATLHWIPDEDQDAVLERVREALEPGRRFVAELGGAGNVAGIVDAVREECAERGYEVESSWYFPTVGKYAPRLETAGFEVRHASLFDRPTEFEGGDAGLETWLEMFGDRLFTPVPEGEREAVVAGVEDRLREEWFRDGTWVAPYRRLRFVAVPTGDEPER